MKLKRTSGRNDCVVIGMFPAKDAKTINLEERISSTASIFERKEESTVTTTLQTYRSEGGYHWLSMTSLIKNHIDLINIDHEYQFDKVLMLYDSTRCNLKDH